MVCTGSVDVSECYCFCAQEKALHTGIILLKALML
jgi:hypothetical protein